MTGVTRSTTGSDTLRRSVPRGASCIGCADLRRLDAAGVAVEQPDAKPPLERLDLRRDHARRQFQIARRRGKSAKLDDPDEGGDLVESVHGTPRLACRQVLCTVRRLQRRNDKLVAVPRRLYATKVLVGAIGGAFRRTAIPKGRLQPFTKGAS